jgi:hypothetical protein
VTIPRLLTNGNGDLRRDGIWTWTLPAWVVELPDGRTYNACPSAAACAPRCYARKGTYLFPAVRAKHTANLLLTVDRLPTWERWMTFEVRDRRMDGKIVRIHDAGDFHSEEYLLAWLRIIRSAPRVRFYAYTKEVAMFRRLVEPDPPPNFRFIYSYGGRQDDAILDTDRRSDVFPSAEAMDAAGYADQERSDLLAINGPLAVGIVVNNHPGASNAMAGQSFREIQANRHSKAGRKDMRPAGRKADGP